MIKFEFGSSLKEFNEPNLNFSKLAQLDSKEPTVSL